MCGILENMAEIKSLLRGAPSAMEVAELKRRLSELPSAASYAGLLSVAGAIVTLIKLTAAALI